VTSAEGASGPDGLISFLAASLSPMACDGSGEDPPNRARHRSPAGAKPALPRETRTRVDGVRARPMGGVDDFPVWR